MKKNTTIEIFKPNSQRVESDTTDTDKGGAIVILYVEDYVKEAERELNNKENYRKTNFDPTTSNNETIHKVISRFQKENLLSKNISEGLKGKNPKTPHFYLQPKVHKEGNQKTRDQFSVLSYFQNFRICLLPPSSNRLRVPIIYPRDNQLS